MQKAYTYKGLSKDGSQQEGLIFANDKLEAYAISKKLGIKKAIVTFDLGQTINSMTKGGEFDQKELSRFYKVIGKRIKSGKSILEGLESAADFIRTDIRLRSAIVNMRQFIKDGATESDAMNKAGFPSRDCLVIKATQAAGRSGEAFMSLATEIENNLKLSNSIKAVFRMPIIMMSAMYVFAYGSMTKLAPKTLAFLKGTGLKINLSAFLKGYFAAATWMNENILLTNAITVAIPVAIFAAYRAGLFRKLLDQIAVMKEISIKSDHASLWGAFSMMYDAGLQVRESCKLLSDAAKREDSSEAFAKLGKMVNVGLEPHQAIEKAGFPTFAVNGFKSAHSSGNLTEGLDDMAKSLYEDVSVLTEILSENIKIYSVIMMAVGVGLIFFVTYYPIVSSVLSNV